MRKSLCYVLLCVTALSICGMIGGDIYARCRCDGCNCESRGGRRAMRMERRGNRRGYNYTPQSDGGGSMYNPSVNTYGIAASGATMICNGRRCYVVPSQAVQAAAAVQAKSQKAYDESVKQLWESRLTEAEQKVRELRQREVLQKMIEDAAKTAPKVEPQLPTDPAPERPKTQDKIDDVGNDGARRDAHIDEKTDDVQHIPSDPIEAATQSDVSKVAGTVNRLLQRFDWQRQDFANAPSAPMKQHCVTINGVLYCDN